MVATDVLIALLRILIGLVFIGHGGQKLFGWLGGAGMTGHSQWIGSLGLQPARLWAWVNALAEFLGGISLALGFLTPIGAAAIIGVMLVAIYKVHWPKGIWNGDGGYEFNVVLIANALFISLAGPGAAALDSSVSLPITYTALWLISMVVMLIGVGLALFMPVGKQTRSPQAS